MRKTTTRTRPVGVQLGSMHPDRSSRDVQVASESLKQIASECGPVVYAIRTLDGAIKIGFTTNIDNRSHWIGPGFSGILALVPGTLDDEQAIHARLKGHQMRGVEYYYPTKAVIAEVNAMRAKFGLSQLAA